MKRIAITLAAVGILTLIPAPAQADPFGGSISHGNDTGYDAAIQVYCDGQWRGVAENRHSDWECDDEDVDKVRVANSGVNIRCPSPTGWWTYLNGSNGLVRNVAFFSNASGCVQTLDD